MTLVRVYSKPNCVQCTQTKRGLERAGIEYVLEDILEPGNLAACKALGYLSAPVVMAGTEHWGGFRPDLINALAARTKENE